MFDAILESGTNSVHKQEGVLSHNYPMELVMKEFSKDIHEKNPDMKPKVFKNVERLVNFFLSTFSYTLARRNPRPALSSEATNPLHISILFYLVHTVVIDISVKTV